MTASEDQGVLKSFEVFSSGGDKQVAVARQGCLFVSGRQTSVTRVCGATLSKDGNLLGVISLDKEAIVLTRREGSDAWEEISKHLLVKRPTAVSFAPSEQEIIIADGFGDLYKLPLSVSVNLRDDANQDKYRMLGHFSTLIAFAISPKFIATGDRDNKLRISRFPDAFVIESFCLAHTEFITCLQWVSEKRLLSGAGDGTIRLWDTSSGSLFGTLRVREHCSLGNTDIADIDVASKGDVVTSICAWPSNRNVAAFSVFGSSRVFVVSGLLSDKPQDAKIACGAEHGHIVTGMAVDEKGNLWVSPSANAIGASAYQLTDDQGNLQLHLDGGGASGGHEALSKAEVPKNSDVMKFEWLHQQRKKEMVEDWKGKKRKHIEI